MAGISMSSEFGACEFNQITVSNSAVTLESLWVAAGGTAFDTLYAKTKRLHAVIEAAADVRYDPEGGTPTTTKGLTFFANTTNVWENQYRLLKTTKVIREGGADVKVDIAIFS